MISNWNKAFTIVAGADLSAAQYKAVNASGVLATSATNGIGINQIKPIAGDHMTVVFLGATKAMAGESLSAGDYVGYDNTTSGFLTAVTSGGIACGRVLTGADSGYLAEVYLFGGPSYIAL